MRRFYCRSKGLACEHFVGSDYKEQGVQFLGKRSAIQLIGWRAPEVAPAFQPLVETFFTGLSVSASANHRCQWRKLPLLFYHY